MSLIGGYYSYQKNGYSTFEEAERYNMILSDLGNLRVIFKPWYLYQFSSDEMRRLIELIT